MGGIVIVWNAQTMFVYLMVLQSPYDFTHVGRSQPNIYRKRGVFSKQPTPTKFPGEVDLGRGSCPKRNSDFLDPTENLCMPV